MTEQPGTSVIVERTAALQASHRPTPAVSIAPLAPATRFSLRLGAEVAARLRQIGPFHLDTPINTCTAIEATTAARLGPDEWLLLAPEQDGEGLARELRRSLLDSFHALVDISHRNAGIAVSGAPAREVLNGGIPLDLHENIFPAGAAKRTLLGKAEVVLLRPGTELSYRVECWRSFAPYVHAFLHDVAREF